MNSSRKCPQALTYVIGRQGLSMPLYGNVYKQQVICVLKEHPEMFARYILLTINKANTIKCLTFDAKVSIHSVWCDSWHLLDIQYVKNLSQWMSLRCNYVSIYDLSFQENDSIDCLSKSIEQYMFVLTWGSPSAAARKKVTKSNKTWGGRDDWGPLTSTKQ